MFKIEMTRNKNDKEKEFHSKLREKIIQKNLLVYSIVQQLPSYHSSKTRSFYDCEASFILV
jgi:hypothetical protein